MNDEESSKTKYKMNSQSKPDIGFASECQLFENSVKKKSCLTLTKRKWSSFLLAVENQIDR